MKNCNDTILNRTRDLSASSAVPQPTVPPRTQFDCKIVSSHIIKRLKSKINTFSLFLLIDNQIQKNSGFVSFVAFVVISLILNFVQKYRKFQVIIQSNSVFM